MAADHSFRDPMNWRRAVVESELPTTSKLLLLDLGLRLDDYGVNYACPSISTLAKELSCTKTTIRTHIRNCVEAGWLVVRSCTDETGRSISSEYRVVMT